MTDRLADWARSGVVALTGQPGGPLLVPPGRAASVAGELAARFVAVTGVPVDGAALLSERAAFTGHRRRGAVSAGGACRLLPTADGWAAVTCARPDDPGLLGVLVADFSALWAGPLCAHLLGLAGARVVKVETPWRPDGARRGNAGFYDLLHAGHRSVVLDPHTSGGRAAMAGLVAAADIVIESSRPRALARFGLDAGAAVAQGATWVSITAYGRASDRAGFGDDVAAASGLVAADTGGSPVFCGDAIADPLTGLTAALRAACAPAGGALLDIAMADVVAATLFDATVVAATVVAATPDPALDQARPSPAARRDAGGWVVDTPAGRVPVARPRRRHARGSGARSGEHTDEVLRELGIGAR